VLRGFLAETQHHPDIRRGALALRPFVVDPMLGRPTRSFRAEPPTDTVPAPEPARAVTQT
jgi:hypothetical protein